MKSRFIFGTRLVTNIIRAFRHVLEIKYFDTAYVAIRVRNCAPYIGDEFVLTFSLLIRNRETKRYRIGYHGRKNNNNYYRKGRSKNKSSILNHDENGRGYLSGRDTFRTSH